MEKKERPGSDAARPVSRPSRPISKMGSRVGPAEFIGNIPKLYAIRALFWMHFFSAVLVKFYTDWCHLTLSEVLFLNSWMFLWVFLLEVPTGTVADVFGRRTSLILGCAASLLVALIYANSKALPLFLLAEFVNAIALTLHSGADEALAYDSLKAGSQTPRAPIVLPRMESYKLGGILFGAVMGGFIAEAFGLVAVMWAYLIPCSAALAVCFTLKEPPVADERRHPSVGTYVQTLLGAGRYFFSRRILVVLAFEMAATNAFIWGLIWLFQPLLGKAGIPILFFGLVHALICAGQILYLHHVAALERLAGSRRRLLLFSTLISGVACVGLGVTTHFLLVPLLIVVAMSFGLTRVPTFTAYINESIPSERRATVLSFISMCRTLGIVLVNPMVGLMAEMSLQSAVVVQGIVLIGLSLASRTQDAHLEGGAGEEVAA